MTLILPDARAVRRLAPRVGLGLAIGAMGGVVLDALGAPLAYMLGAVFATMAASILGAPVAPSTPLRSAFLVVIGLSLSESFTADLAGQVQTWSASIALALAYTPTAGAISYLVYRRLARLDWVTALFCAIPGGLSAVVFMSRAVGADEQTVTLAQAFRVSFVVASAPVLFFGALGLEAGAGANSAALVVGHGSLTGVEALWLAAGTALCWLALRLAGLPLPYLLAPLIAGAALRVGGVVDGVLPEHLVEAALVVVGASLGCRFAGVGASALLATVIWTSLSCVTLWGVSVAFAVAATWATGVDLVVTLLAFAPGGVAEMALIAIALDADPAFVATHHIVRIIFIMVLTPLLAVRIKRPE